MAQLIKVTTGQILPGREFWKLSNGFEVVVSTKDGKSTLFVSGRGSGKNVEHVSKYLEAQGMGHELVSTIDSHAIVVPLERKLEAMELIEQWQC